MSDKRSLSPSQLFFCPRCRRAFARIETCGACNVRANAEAATYTERLLETVLSTEPCRAGMAMDVLTWRLHELRTIVPLTLLLSRTHDPAAQVLGARGLGRLRAASAVPALVALLLDEDQPYVARVAAADSLGKIGGQEARQALQQATQSPRSSVSGAALRALDTLREANRERLS